MKQYLNITLYVQTLLLLRELLLLLVALLLELLQMVFVKRRY